MFARRLLVIALAGLIGAVTIGLLAPNVATLVLGILALGLGMILAILFYLLRPVPSVLLADLPEFPEVTPGPATTREAANRLRRGQPSADIIAFPRAPE